MVSASALKYGALLLLTDHHECYLLGGIPDSQTQQPLAASGEDGKPVLLPWGEVYDLSSTGYGLLFRDGQNRLRLVADTDDTTFLQQNGSQLNPDVVNWINARLPF